MEELPQDQNLDWKRPDQIMKLRKFKLRKFALQARFNGSSIADSRSSNSLLSHNLSSENCTIIKKRKNPFLKIGENKKIKENPPADLETDTSDSTFELLNLQSSNSFQIENLYKSNASFEQSLLADIESNLSEPVIEEPKGNSYIPIDWTLKTKLRLMSPKPFAWKVKLKASEEASGTTGFVRCLDIGEQQTTLDTSPNARFHQCCLVWQHPSLPWMELYPRSQSKLNLANTNFVPMNQMMKDALYKEWCSSFRSLFHLLRVRQCPYFYVCGNNFTVLFRAAGICGISEVQALITPTTRGLRESLKNEEIEFTMPLKSKLRKTKSAFELIDNNDDDEKNDSWLKSVGIEDSEIRKISFSQSKVQTHRECDVDNIHESLIFVTGVEVQALFNFLINCKTIITICGPYSGVPPTLLSPVAFHGASLRPLKVRESTVSNGQEKYYSLELIGPILPDVLPSLCSLMSCHQIDKFSVSCAQLTNTAAFSKAKHGTEIDRKTEALPQNIFGLESLTDCGFTKKILSHFCNPEPNRIENFESLTCDNNLYTWS